MIFSRFLIAKLISFCRLRNLKGSFGRLILSIDAFWLKSRNFKSKVFCERLMVVVDFKERLLVRC